MINVVVNVMTARKQRNQTRVRVPRKLETLFNSSSRKTKQRKRTEKINGGGCEGKEKEIRSELRKGEENVADTCFDYNTLQRKRESRRKMEDNR